MKKLTISSEGLNHSSIDLGKLDDLKEYSYMHPKRQQEVQGKVFIGEFLKSSSAEISFTVFPPHTEMPFFHQHKDNEEIYVVLKGAGQFQIDETLFDISEGSVIRVSPKGRRTYRNNSDTPLILLCIQNKINTLDQFNVEDGFLAEGETLWNN